MFDLGLRFAQLGFAMTFQHRAAFIGGDGVVKLGLAVFKLLDEFFKLNQRILKA